MKTVTVKGKVYQVNMPYVCVDTGKIGYLYSNVTRNGKPFQLSVRPDFNPTRGGEVILANEIEPFTAGTIEDAPIKLEDGEWYMCERGGIPCPLYYANSWFHDWCEDVICESKFKPLYKMVKA